MDHLKEALVRHIQARKKHVDPHELMEEEKHEMPSDELHESPEHQALEEKMDAHDQAPELSNPTDIEEADEMHADNDPAVHPGLGYDKKDQILESIASHGDRGNHHPLHVRAAEHAKNDLHAMKKKKSY